VALVIASPNHLEATSRSGPWLENQEDAMKISLGQVKVENPTRSLHDEEPHTVFLSDSVLVRKMFVRHLQVRMDSQLNPA
jgi:hypothetical protein